MNKLAVKHCPFCGEYPVTTDNKYWTGMSSKTLSVSMTHHCPKQEGVINMYVSIRAKDTESAVAQWNTRIED